MLLNSPKSYTLKTFKGWLWSSKIVTKGRPSHSCKPRSLTASIPEAPLSRKVA